MKGKVVITIPIYKENPSIEEITSLKQCVRILGHYNLYFFCAQNLNIKNF
jgi:hypothetical protein